MGLAVLVTLVLLGLALLITLLLRIFGARSGDHGSLRTAGRNTLRFPRGRAQVLTSDEDIHWPEEELSTQSTDTCLPSVMAPPSKLSPAGVVRGHQPNPELQTLRFEANSAQLREAHVSSISGLARFLKEHPEYDLELRGSADSLGTPANNRRLALRRAAAVKARLIELGVGSERVRFGQPRVAVGLHEEQRQSLRSVSLQLIRRLEL